MLKIQEILTDMRREPLALTGTIPAFSYTATSDRAGDRQIARRVCVTLGERTVFDSGRVEDAESLHIPYGGEPLLPYTRYRVHITVWSEGGECAEGDTHFTTGPLDGALAEADWIAPSASCEPYRAYRMRKAFTARGKIRQALAYFTSTNFFDLYINDKRPDERRFTPAASPSGRRYYESYDITDLVTAGENTVGLIMGDGYYTRSYNRYACWQYEGIRRVLGLLHLTYEDGSTETVTTDGTWVAATEPSLTENSIYQGEHYDARLAMGFTDDRTEGYRPVILLKPTGEEILPSTLPAILVEKYFDFTDAHQMPDGRVILDFGQNMSGFVRIERAGKRGDTLTLRHSEMIYRDTWELDTRNLRDAKQTDTYTYGEDGTIVFEPRFTYHGFRYVEISGLSGIPEKGEFRAAFLHAALDKTMEFSCDDARIMQLYHNATHSIRSNTMSYSTDCAGRDERTSCSMDLAAYVDFASHYWNNYHHSGQFMRQIMKREAGNPEWDGAQIFILRALWRTYGDLRLLREEYPIMRSHLLETAKTAKDGVLPGIYGDWCAPHPNMKGLFRESFSHVSETSTALLYHLADAMCELAAACGEDGDIPEYRAIMRSVKEGYDSAFFRKDDFTYSDGDQAPCVLPLAFGMVDDDKRAGILAALDRAIARRDGHLDTGIFATRYVATVLADEGRLAEALDAYFHPTYPSFADQFARGATTLWEQWVEIGSMATHNHAMFAGACAFITEKLFGLVRTEGAYRTVVLRPMLIPSVGCLSITRKTLRGDYVMSYERSAEGITLSLTVPFGCLAILTMPSGKEYRLAAGTHTLCE